MDKQIAKNIRKARRKAKTRSTISGTSKCPRLSVFRSNTSVYAQLIDDIAGRTIVSAHSSEIKEKKTEKDDDMGIKVKTAFLVGKLIATKAGEKKIAKVVFDRGSFLYHGRIKAIADGARAGGLIF